MRWDIVRELSCLDVGVDPGHQGAESGVDTRVASLSAALAPGDETNEGLGLINDGATAVTRARVLATLLNTSAEHVVGDG